MIANACIHTYTDTNTKQSQFKCTILGNEDRKKRIPPRALFLLVARALASYLLLLKSATAQDIGFSSKKRGKRIIKKGRHETGVVDVEKISYRNWLELEY